MQYHCVQCDERFEVGHDDDKPRCPKCLRQHGLRKLDATPAASAGSRWPQLLGVALVLVLAGGGFFYFRHVEQRARGPVGLEPLSTDELAERVKTAAGVDAAELAQLLAPDSSLEAFGARVMQGKVSAVQKAEAVALAIAERAAKQAFSVWPRTDPRDTAPMLARQVLPVLTKDAGRAQLYPLEVAAFAVAVLRSADVPASIAEVYRYPDEQTALDPSGRLGYYALALPAEQPGGVARLYDVYGGRKTAPKPTDFSVLNDVQALGAALSLRAMHRLTNESDPKGALADAEAAVKLSPSSASSRSVRGAILLASGGTEEGSRELEAALSLRNDAARHNNLAMLALARGDTARATKEVTLALGEAPQFAAAHLTLATINLSNGERDQARAELEKCESLERDLPALPLAWAELYAGSGELSQALAKAEEGVRLRPKSPEPHLVLARIDRQAGRYDDMRRQAQQVLALATSTDADRVKALLRQVLGPTALEVPAAPEPEAAAPAATDLRLGAKPDAPGASGPRLLDQDTGKAAEPGALQLGAPASKLHLGGSDSKLKLDLSH
ncbi:MAG TPA: tetratricopeptide repeat protein [Polyangiales bacterium]